MSVFLCFNFHPPPPSLPLLTPPPLLHLVVRIQFLPRSNVPEGNQLHDETIGHELDVRGMGCSFCRVHPLGVSKTLRFNCRCGCPCIDVVAVIGIWVYTNQVTVQGTRVDGLIINNTQ